jgi:HAD superfamily hydrolase (TIGR01509 family)
MLKALIFDVDGTLADTEMAHLAAFNHAFAEAGLDWHWDVPLYTQLLEVSGGKERIHAYWKSRGDMPKEVGYGGITQTIAHLHEMKTAAYEQAVQSGHVQMRPGVLPLMRSAIDAGLHLAIATTTSPVNITQLLKQCIGPDWTSYFSVIEDASTAPRKKPDPSVYLQTLARLGLDAASCLAIEDSANGLRAATAAGLSTLITTNPFTEHHKFEGAIKVLPSLEGVTLSQMQAWHAQSHVSA